MSGMPPQRYKAAPTTGVKKASSADFIGNLRWTEVFWLSSLCVCVSAVLGALGAFLISDVGSIPAVIVGFVCCIWAFAFCVLSFGIPFIRSLE